MGSLTTRSRADRSQIGLAAVDAEEILERLARERQALEHGLSNDVRPRLSDVWEWLETALQDLREALGSAGLTVEQTARRLDVSQPTVRKWIKEGLLRQLPDRKPLEVEPRSIVEVERVLANVKASYPSRQWTQALAAFLHDRDLLQTGWASEGAVDFQRGEFVERDAAPDEDKIVSMTPPNKRTVTPHERGWSVDRPGAQRASSVHPTQQEAIDAARQNLKKSGGGELVVKGRNGRIRDQDTVSPGNDPRSSKG